MAIEAERLIINLEARLNKFDSDMRKAVGISDKTFRQIERRAQEAESRLKGIGAGIGRGLGAFAAAAIGVQTVGDIAKYAAQYRDLQNALKVTGLEGKALTDVFNQLSQIAIRQGAPLDALVTLYSRASQSSKDLKASQADLIQFSEGIATALRVQGTSATEASGALLQLSQALSNGKVSAEEYNSLLDGGQAILQATAAGMVEAGGSVSKLTALVKDGQVSSAAFFRAFLAGQDSLQEKAAKSEGTVSQSFERIGTAMTLLIGHLDEVTGSSNNATVSLDAVAGVIQKLPGYVDAAARGFKSLQSYLDGIGSSSVFAKINEALGYSDPDFLRSKGLTPGAGSTSSGADSRIGSAFDATAGTGIPEGVVAADKSGRNLAAAADKAAISIKDFAVEADDATKKTKEAKLASAPIETAERFRGATEDRDGNILGQFFRSANVNVDPKMTAWCAAFVNAALATNGLPGTGSLSARSFQNYGEETNNPTRGDIVVLSRGKDARQGHVGFFEGYDEKGGVRVLGGNQDDSVSTKSFSKDRVLSFRKIPGAERASEADTLAAELERRKDVTAAMQGQTDAYNELVAGSVAFVAAQNAEAQAVGLTQVQAAKLRYEQELLNQAAQAGLTLTPQQTAQISQLAEGMAQAEQAAIGLADTQERLAEVQAEFQDIAKESVRGFVDDLIAGKSAGEALEGVLKNIASRLLDMAVDNLFENIFSGGGAKGGGGVGGFIGKLFGFSDGGYTGAGGKNEVAGVVHGGEYVMSKDAVQRIGLQNLERLHRGYEAGGFVGMTPPNLRASGASVGPASIKVINPPGMPLEAESKQNPDGSIEIMMRQVVKDEVTSRGRGTNGLLRRSGVQQPLRDFS